VNACFWEAHIWLYMSEFTALAKVLAAYGIFTARVNVRTIYGYTAADVPSDDGHLVDQESLLDLEFEEDEYEPHILTTLIYIKNPLTELLLSQDVKGKGIRDSVHYQRVSVPSEYATQVLDKNHTGLISIQQIAKDPVLRYLLVPSSVILTFFAY
jgi:hypothetical protein